MAHILEVQHLVKKYPGVTAVDGVSFSIGQGLCFGLLGPNGAGKTTTIEIAEGILAPTKGVVLYKGAPRTQRFKEEVGIQFQSTSLLDFLTVRESLETFRSLYRNPMQIQDLIGLCQLEDILSQANNKISGGQKQRLLIAIALVNNPELIFLDEPTTGLDPQARRHLWDIVETIKAEGKTVVLTTHYMEEAQQLCDEIAIIDSGRIIAQGDPEELIRKDGAPVTIRIPQDALTPENSSAIRRLRDAGPVRSVFERHGHFEIFTDDVNACIQRLIGSGVDLSRANVRSKNLEDLFLELTGRQLRD
jgi:ABC-2 type transport system ATP-binding protein